MRFTSSGSLSPSKKALSSDSLIAADGATSAASSPGTITKGESQEQTGLEQSNAYLKSVNARQLALNANRHNVFLSEASSAVSQILRSMQGHRVSEALITRVTTLLLGSEEEGRFSGSIPMYVSPLVIFRHHRFGTRFVHNS